MTRISSQKYLAGSRGATCKLQIPDVCTGDVETTVPAHIRDRHTGRGVKASDMSVADACFACHEVFDHRAKLPNGTFLTGADWLFYALRGLQDTLESRHEAGLLFVSQDAVKSFNDRPTKPRMAKASRPIPQRENPWPEESRPLQSRNNLRKVPQ
jgi:hypothetical protein